MTLSLDGQNAAADGVAAVYTWLSLWDGDPQGSGTEISGGSPAYARKSVTWGAASGGQRAATNVPIVFDVPACTVTHWAVHSAVTGGTLGGSGPFSQIETFAAQDNKTVNVAILDPLAN